MKNGTVLLKKEAYTRKKGLDAYVEFYVVGETAKDILVTRYPTRGLEKAVKVPKKADLQEFGFFKSWDEVKAFIAAPKSTPAPAPMALGQQILGQQIAQVTDVDKIRRIQAILNETAPQPKQRRARRVQQPVVKIPKPIQLESEPKYEDIPKAARMRRPVTILRRRNENGEFVPMSKNNVEDKSVH